MNKKTYSAPKVTKVKLDTRQSVLGTCNDTTTAVAGTYGNTECKITMCFYATP